MDYGQFGDVVTLDTTYKLNKEHRPFGTFVGFNHHRETVMFGAVLMYDETAESIIWLFQHFFEAMSNKCPKTIFIDQDASIVKAISFMMSATNHRLCTRHLMQNVVRHVSSLFQDIGVKAMFSKFMRNIKEEDEFKLQWEQMLDKFDARNNHWLEQTFRVKDKWGWPYITNSWPAEMSTTQLSKAFSASLKDYLNSDHNLMQFFMHFKRVLYDKRYKELPAEYNLCQKVPRVAIPVKMLKQVVELYTKTIFEEFQNEYVQSIEATIEQTVLHSEVTIYKSRTEDGKKDRDVTKETNDSLTCSCKKFEVKGILCRHCLKVLRDVLNAKELPNQYILKL